MTTIKQHHYATGNGEQQSVVQVESPAVKVGGTKVTVAVGKDTRLDRTANGDPTVVDVNAKQPIGDFVEIRGRLRTSYHPDKASSQARLGVQVNVPVSENGSLYAQVYGVDKLSSGGRTSGLQAGAFVGYDHQFTDRYGGYVEVQAYDLSDMNRQNVGVNIGFRGTF